LEKLATRTVKPIRGKNSKWKIIWLTMEKIFFSVVGYNAAEIFLIFELKYFHENQFFSKMILTHESEAQEDQFDGKKRRPKISWYYPFKSISISD
jgi:hypothetical protein